MKLMVAIAICLLVAIAAMAASNDPNNTEILARAALNALDVRDERLNRPGTSVIDPAQAATAKAEIAEQRRYWQDWLQGLQER